MSNEASFVIAAPWPHSPECLCHYTLGGITVFNGTLQDAEIILERVKYNIRNETDRSNYHPKVDDYQIFQLVPINSVK
jgi:N-acetylmuramoyl-L-alanine amidase CwlA